MANGRIKESEVPLCAFVTLLLTHCYSVFAILDRRVYTDEDLRRNYRLEDFLWTGSGDGENETDPSPVDEQTSWERTTTVFHTTTVISTATIFYSKTLFVTTPESNTTAECTNDPNCIIEPTPTLQLSSSTIISPWPPPTEYPYGDYVPDQNYWLITILKVNTSAIYFVPKELEEHLAKLYQIAFHRHQEHHLGLNGSWNKSNLRSQQIFRQKRNHRDRVTVQIHNVTNNEALKILYSVKVSGHPVLATTAAHDMKLVSDAEVVAELGYPILTKAEPYLKQVQYPIETGAFRDKEYLYVLVSSLCAAILVILFVLLLLLTVRHKKRRRMESRKTDSQHIIKKGESQTGIDNEAFTESKPEQKQHSATRHRNGRTDSTEGSHGRHQSQCHLRPHTRRPASPNSFLSMPSVKDFPTTPLPEPLTSLLNTGSPPTTQDKLGSQVFSRHGSLESEDPGVLGPMVWDAHCHRLKQDTPDEDRFSLDSEIDMGRMRRRFNELLDDALSLYESHRSLHENTSQSKLTSKNFDIRSQSAAHFRETETISIPAVNSRPKTSMNAPNQRKQPKKVFPQPRNAWESSTPATPVRLHSRPLSAGPFHRPTIHPEVILSDAQLSPNDPAVPVISAIKKELDKMPTYRSSSRFISLKESDNSSDHEA